jgi:hypothetical protein
MKVKNASHSAISTYEECPLKYKIERVDKRKAEPSPAMKKGSAFHAGGAAYIRHLQAEGLQTDVTWIDEAMAAARAKMKEEGHRLNTEEWAEVEEILNTFISSHVFEPAAIAEVEEMKRIPLDGGTQFWGVIDLLEAKNGRAEITDWKTDQRIRSQAEVEKDDQLGRYAWMTARLYGYEEVLCRLDFVRFGAVREAVFGPAEIAKAEAGVLNAIDAIAAETEWPATPGSQCSWCAWAEECQAISDLQISITTAEDAERVAGEVLVLEKQLKDRKAALKGWTSVEGALVVGGQQFSHFESRGFKATDIIAISRFMEMRDLDPADYFSINNKKLQPLMKDEVFAANIEPHLEETVSTSFRHKKAKGD